MLRKYEPLLHAGDALMVSIACEATDVCSSPIGIVSVMEEGQERFIGCVGTDIECVDRSVSICAHTILEPDPLVVEDVRLDARFRNLPYVVGPPFIRFYAGAPVIDRSGLPIGSVCVLHTQPHEVSSKCLLALGRLALVAAAVLETRLLAAATRDRSRLDDLLLTILEPRPSCG